MSDSSVLKESAVVTQVRPHTIDCERRQSAVSEAMEGVGSDVMQGTWSCVIEEQFLKNQTKFH